jgi:aminoglycoside/choline kinase family phosphotransferase
MKSIQNKNPDERKEKLLQWLESECGLRPLSIQAIPSDASTRRYFRLQTANHSFVAMDAKPPAENCLPYIAIANALRNIGINTPEIFAANTTQGYLLLTNFGDVTYLKALTTKNADLLYRGAWKVLSVLQNCREVPGLNIPSFTANWMWQEWAWHKEWFLDKLLGLTLSTEEQALDQCYAQIVESALLQPQVFMHRDYHSANLMLLPDDSVGVLDFQDAFIGPVTYDLVSLLRDCYIDWEEHRVYSWALDYWKALRQINVLSHVDSHIFLRWFDWMGIERHLKALFTFARKEIRDHQPRYLSHIPRTLNYLLCISRRYPELIILYNYFNEIVRPACLNRISLCAQ